MPEMSADVEPPDSSLTAVETPTAPDHVQAPFSGAPEGPLPAAAAATAPLPNAPGLPATDAPRWRLAAAGYLLIAAGFALVLSIPHLRVRAGIREEALVIVAITSMLAGAAGIVLSFVLNLFR